GAEHRAVVVGEHQDHGPRPEVLAEPDGPPVLVLEDGVERQARAETLRDPDPTQDRGARVARGAVRGSRRRRRRSLRERRKGEKDSRGRGEDPHGRLAPAAAPVSGSGDGTGSGIPPGTPRSTTICIARTIGIRATPAW